MEGGSEDKVHGGEKEVRLGAGAREVLTGEERAPNNRFSISWYPRWPRIFVLYPRAQFPSFEAEVCRVPAGD